MNFFQFLQECKSKDVTLNENTYKDESESNKKITRASRNKEHKLNKNENKSILNNIINGNVSNNITYDTEFKIGDFITIVRSEKDSKLNYYKGYIGEIKSYSKFSNNAYVILDALNSNKVISFPIEHLKPRPRIR